MFKVGDKVRCLHKSYDGNITQGKIYEVIEAQDDDYDWVWIIQNNGRQNGWQPRCFELVKKRQKFYK